jgi:PAS domain S-box-containing protein
MSTSEDNALLKAMVSFSPDLICALDQEGYFQQISDACHRNLGHKSTELIGQLFSSIIHPDDQAFAWAKCLEALEQSEAVAFESRCLGKGGQQVLIAWSALRAATGLLICVGRDVTAQRQTMLQARKLDAQHQAIIEHGFDMVALLNELGTYTYVGGAIRRILGYEPEDMVGHNRLEFIHPADQALAQPSQQQLADQPSLVMPDCRFRTSAGEWRWIETTISHYPEQSDSKAYYILNSRDITERKLTTLALAESEQRFRLLFDNNAALAVFQSTDGIVLDANPAMLSFLEKDQQDVLQKPLADFLPEEVRALFQEKHLEAAGGRKVQFEVQVTIAESIEKTLKVTKTPLVVSGNIIGVYGSVRDITEIAHAQRLIRQQAEQLNTLLESINDAFISLDRSWNLTYLNSQAEQLLGISQEGALGLNLWVLFPEAVAHYQQHQQALDTGETVRFELYFKPLRRWFEVKAYPFSGGVSVFFADITKRIEDEKQLKLLALVARNTDNGVVITDAAGRVEWVNEAYVKDTGYALDELRGRTPGAVLQGPETDPATRRFIRERLAQQSAFSATVLNYRKSGKKVWLAMDVTPVRNEAGQLTQYVAVLQNITFRKEVEASQAAMTQDLYRHNRDLQQFTYVISHNLRAPLANALGLAGVLAKVERQSPAFGEALAHLRQSMLQADAVLKDLNLVLSIRDKKDVLVPERLRFDEVCRQAVEHLDEALQACGGHVALELDPDLVTRGNRAYLYSIFHNLLSNAIKYRSEERPLRVVIACFAGAHGGPTITFTDNGSGFDMFKAGSEVFQLYKRFHTNQRGRGIGLFLVKAHVEAMGGKIEVASEVNFGTRFTIHLDKH